MKPTAIGLIGTGTMGSAIAKAIAERTEGTSLYLSNRTVRKAEELARQIPGAKVTDSATAASLCDILFLAVKPQNMKDLFRQIVPALEKRSTKPLLVSMAAGLTCGDLCSMAGGDYPVIRMMPNTPVCVGAGLILYCSCNLEDGMAETFEEILSSAGSVDAIPEEKMDAASALSGCGPAFACLFLEALADGAVACGLPRDKALLYAEQMLEGTAKMARETGKNPASLKDEVCSPGGSTIAGVRALEAGGFRSCSMESVIASFEKTKQLR